MSKLLPQRIVTMREYRGLSQADLAEISGVGQAYISKLERGKAPNAAGLILSKLAIALDTTVDYFLGLSDDPSPRPVANHPALRDPRFAYLAEMWDLMPEYARDHLRRQVKLMEKLNPDLRAAMAERGWELPDVGEK